MVCKIANSNIEIEPAIRSHVHHPSPPPLSRFDVQDPHVVESVEILIQSSSD